MISELWNFSVLKFYSLKYKIVFEPKYVSFKGLVSRRESWFANRNGNKIFCLDS